MCKMEQNRFEPLVKSHEAGGGYAGVLVMGAPRLRNATTAMPQFRRPRIGPELSQAPPPHDWTVHETISWGSLGWPIGGRAGRTRAGQRRERLQSVNLLGPESAASLFLPFLPVQSVQQRNHLRVHVQRAVQGARAGVPAVPVVLSHSPGRLSWCWSGGESVGLRSAASVRGAEKGDPQGGQGRCWVGGQALWRRMRGWVDKQRRH